MAVATSTNGPAASDELLPALHEEIARLPEKYRLAVVLCDLEGMTQAQAAGQLHWSERTLQRRLAEGRDRLKAPTGPTRAGTRRRDAGRRVPARGAGRRAGGLARSDRSCRGRRGESHRSTVGAVSAAAQQLAQEVFKIMLLQKLTLASAALLAAGLIGWGASAALVSLGRGAPQEATAPPVAAARPTADTAVPRPKPGSADTVGTFPVRGRVLDPDGKPVAGAGVYVRHYAERRWSEIDPMAARQKGRVAVD